MSSFKCPFCGNFMSEHDGTVTTRRFNFDGDETIECLEEPFLDIKIYRCPNSECQKESIVAQGINGYLDDATFNVYPRVIYRTFPDYVPQAIRTDYEEACSILESSPKAAATLARRCMQGMIRDFWGIHEKNLNAEITTLKSKISPALWNAIDAVRRIGNIGAHMEHDVNLIIDVDPDEARLLLKLIEHLIEKWYIDRHDTECLFNSIIEIDEAKKEARSNP